MTNTITPEKLRVMSADWSLGPGELRNALDDAADRIEALEATNAKLLAALALVVQDLSPEHDMDINGLQALIAAQDAIAAAKGESK